jgi:nitrous oxidase accessory protein
VSRNIFSVKWLILLVGLGWLLLSASTTAAQEADFVVSAEQLATAVSQAQNGDIIEVTGGTYFGSLEIDKSLTLIGHDWPVLDGKGVGTVLKLTGPNTVLRGFIIRNSGHVLDQENSGVAVEAQNIVIEGNRFEETLFGIYLREAHNSVVRDNLILSKDLDVPRRGDGIRIWYSQDVLVENNTVEKGRDVVLWYSERLTIRGNDIQNGRYGLHFMYCDDALIENNRLLNNSVGAFLMYSRRLVMTHNTVAYNRGPSGYGIGMKDLDDAVVFENLFLDNRIGAHLDGTPREVDSIGRFEGNVFAYNDIGVNMMPSVRHNEFFNNSFVDNEEQMAIAGGGTPGDNAWTVGEQGNFWSDYAGYDADGDGHGDIEYRSERLFENLMQNDQNLRLFLYSPATNAIDFAARAFPLVRPQPKLTDERPLTSPRIPTNAPPLPQPNNQSWFWLALLLVSVAGALVALPHLNWRRYKLPVSLKP